MNTPVLVEEAAVEDRLDTYVEDMLDEREAPDETEDYETVPVEAAPEEEPGQAAEDEDEFIEITHNGRPVKLKLDEVIEHAQKGFDYTTKTMELADQRRELVSQQQTFQQHIQMQQQTLQAQAQLYAMDAQLQQYQSVNWDAWVDDNPIEAQKGWQKYQILREQRNGLIAGIQQQQAQMAYETQAGIERQVAEGAKVLSRELKGWGADLQRAIKAAGKGYGFSDDELATVFDPRMVRVLNDARQWQELQAKKPQIQKRVADAPKAAKPSGKVDDPVRNRRDMIKKLKGSRDVRRREAIANSMLDKFV